MSKSIFIIDTPACCGECPMSGTGVCRKWSMKEAHTFPKDCTLVKAPDKKIFYQRWQQIPGRLYMGLERMRRCNL